MIEKIISGGQTGVDQAALRVATELNIPVGGRCPLNGWDENRIDIRESYPLTAMTGLAFDKSIVERTKRNVRDSDGTLIIVSSLPLSNTRGTGTILTIEYAREINKPFLILSFTSKSPIDVFSAWIKQYDIKILNIASHRESVSPGIYDKTSDLLREILPSCIF